MYGFYFYTYSYSNDENYYDIFNIASPKFHNNFNVIGNKVAFVKEQWYKLWWFINPYWFYSNDSE